MILPEPSRRVLLLSRGGPLDGSQWQLCHLARGLDRRRYEAVVVLTEGGPTAQWLARNGVEVHVLPLRPWRSLPTALLRHIDLGRLRRLAQERRISLVHASDPWKSGYMHAVARHLGVPSVVHVRGPMSARDLRKHGIDRADGVIAIARRYYDDLVSAGIPSRRLALVDDAVDFDRFLPDPAAGGSLRQRFGIDGRVLVGLVGRIEPFKRIIEFLEAVAPLARSAGNRAGFMVIGQPGPEPYHQAVRQAVVRLGLTGQVVFTNHCEDMPAVISALDLLVTMSGGSVMFEAMACAKAVLSVRTDDRHSEHTRHDQTAWCVTADRPEPAAEAMARLIDDADLRARLGAAGRVWAEQHLSVATLVERTQQVYDRLGSV